MRMRFVEHRGPFHAHLLGYFTSAVLLGSTLLAVGSETGAQKPAGILQPPLSVETANLSAAPGVGNLAKAGSATAVSITDVTSSRETGRVVISAAASGRISHQESLIPNPPRLVVDLLDAELASPFYDLKIGSAGVLKVRVRQYQSTAPKIARMVFDLEEKHGKHEILEDGQSLRVVFHEVDPGLNPAPAPDAKPAPPAPQAPPAAAKRTQPERAQGAAPPAQPDLPRPAPPKAAAKPVSPAAGPERAAAPVIRDLAVSEIPRSALTSTTAEAKPQPSPASRPAAPPPPTPPPVRTAPVPAALAVPAQSGPYSGHPLTLDLIDISLVDFFRLMAEEGGINIVMDPEIKGTISIKVVKVPWDQIFDAALLNNGLDKMVEGNLVRISRKSTLQEEARQREALKKANMLAADVETRIKRLNYAKATEMVDTLMDQKTVRGTVVVDERTNSLLLSDLPVSLDKMVDLIEKLDVPQPQVEIEARIVSATREFARDIGVQFGFVGGNLERVTVGGPNTFGTIGGTRPAATPMNTYAAGNPYTGRGASQAQSTQSGAVSTGNTNNNAGNYNVNIPSQKPFGGIGISVGNIFDTFLLDAAITAGETKGLAKLISQPKVTAQNNSAASITQGLRFPVQIIANNTVTVQFQNAALTLTVTPQITYEGNVVLDLKVENNTPDFANSVNGIPSIRTSESATRVLVSDGGTTVIGGILIDNETTQEDRVPGLASLPVIGNVFKRTAISHSTQEVLFFITPRIVK